jgi:hypothetical protein
MRFAHLLALCLPAFGQTQAVAPVTKAPGDKVTLEISADSQPDRMPVRLKWEVVFPVQLMEMDTDGPEPGSAAKASDKSLECMSRSPYRLVCTLSGGPKPIANGIIAVYHFKIRDKAKAGPTVFKIEKAESTTMDSTVTALNDTDTAVVIQ